MILSRCNFGPCPPNLVKGMFEDLVENFIVTMLRNGQALGHYYFAWDSGCLWCYVPLSRRDSFDKLYLSDYGKNSYQELLQAVGREPAWEILDDEGIDEIADWQSEKQFVLFTHFLDETAPLVSLSLYIPVAIFKLPISDSLKDELYSWAKLYRECDAMFMTGSTELEMIGYREMVEITSSLSTKGRELCCEIENSTRVPTYYYLHRYWGNNSEIASGRVCPGCGCDWMKAPYNFNTKFLEFSFSCDDCRLVSHHPKSFLEPVKARIGKWRKDRRSKELDSH